MTPVAAIRLCGAHTYHENQTLRVVADSEAAVRGVPDAVTMEQARALVGRNEAVWIGPPPEVPSKEGA